MAAILILTKNGHFSERFYFNNVLSNNYLQDYTNKQDVSDFSRVYMSITNAISEMSAPPPPLPYRQIEHLTR